MLNIQWTRKQIEFLQDKGPRVFLWYRLHMNTTCPHCTNSDMSMIELLAKTATSMIYLCAVCGKKFLIKNGDK